MCRAITEGDPWPKVTSVPPRPEAPNDYQACLDGELVAMLQRALQFHAEFPDRVPRVSFPRAGTTSPCQRQLYGVRVLDESELPDESRPGTVPVAITVPPLNEEPSFTVDGESVTPIGTNVVDAAPGTEGLDTYVVLAPLTDEPRTAEIVVETHRGALPAEVRLPAGGPTTQTTTPTETDTTPAERTTSPTEQATQPATEAPTTTRTP